MQKFIIFGRLKEGSIYLSTCAVGLDHSKVTSERLECTDDWQEDPGTCKRKLELLVMNEEIGNAVRVRESE